jgi:hypothetical protein
VSKHQRRHVLLHDGPAKRRQTHVVDADIVQYFDRIPHGDLLKSVARRIADGKILRLFKLWLKSPVEVGATVVGRWTAGAARRHCGARRRDL